MMVYQDFLTAALCHLQRSTEAKIAHMCSVDAIIYHIIMYMEKTAQIFLDSQNMQILLLRTFLNFL